MDAIENSPLAREPPILRLSPALRRQIYSHFHDALGSKPCNLHLHGGNGEAAFGIPALLLSCRRIYEEVSEVLYSTNFFDIKCQGAGSLERIRNLHDMSLSLLTELKIVLNQVSCHNVSCVGCCDNYNWNPWGCAGQHMEWHDQPLRPSDDSANNLLVDWGLAAAYICPRVRPTKLNLAFVCDFDPQDPRTISAASLAMAPLIKLAPLRGCHIRLCRRRNSELEQIARDTVSRACGIWVQDGPTSTLKNATLDSAGSMLMSLPRELRLHILEYTDLITPWGGEIDWRQSDKKYLYGETLCEDQQLGSSCAGAGHHECQFRSCWTDFRELEFEYSHAPVETRPRVGCFCRARHAAFSLNCRCWSPPTNLFLVCQALCKDAQVVFFSGHRFIISEAGPVRLKGGARDDSSYRFAVVEFLRDVVPADIINQIRSLQVNMKTYSRDSWPWDESSALSEWKDTVQFMRDNMNLEGLTLDLCLGDIATTTLVPKVVTKPLARKFLQPYFRILAPLAGLGDQGLKEFSSVISLPIGTQAPWCLDRWSTGPPGSKRDAEAQREQILRNRAGGLVMGSRHSEEPGRGLCWSSEELEDVLWNQES